MLVVGGTGLIGRALAGALVDAGLQPLLAARHEPAPGLLPAGARFVGADRVELPMLIGSGRILAGPTLPLGVVDVLATGPQETAPLLQSLGRRRGRFVAIGSAAVYGQALRGLRYGEATVPLPSTEPMRRKLALEQLIAAHSASGRGATMLRVAYPYGPGHGPLTPLGRTRELFARLAGGDPVDWVAPGEFAPLQPLAAADLARAIVALLTRDDPVRPLYHVAGPEIVDWGEYLRLLARGNPLDGRVRLHRADALMAMNPAAWWIGSHLRQAPLLDDAPLRREVYACDTRLVDALPEWAAWCSSGRP